MIILWSVPRKPISDCGEKVAAPAGNTQVDTPCHGGLECEYVKKRSIIMSSSYYSRLWELKFVDFVRVVLTTSDVIALCWSPSVKMKCTIYCYNCEQARVLGIGSRNAKTE
jgi:hypothetical protein